MAQPLLDIRDGRAQSRRIGAESHAPHQAVGAFQLARERVALFFQARDFGPARHRGVHKFLVLAPRIVQVVSLIPGQDGFPQEIEQDSVEGLEAVLIAQIISEQDVLLEKEHVVLAAFDKGQAIVQNVVRGRTSSSPNSAFRDLPRLFSSIS